MLSFFSNSEVLKINLKRKSIHAHHFEFNLDGLIKSLQVTSQMCENEGAAILVFQNGHRWLLQERETRRFVFNVRLCQKIGASCSSMVLG